MRFLKLFIVFQVFGLCILQQGYVARTDTDTLLIILEVRFNCEARCIVFQRTCHILGMMYLPQVDKRTSASFPEKLYDRR